MNDLNLFKKNGFLVKENLISQSKINKINTKNRLIKIFKGINHGHERLLIKSNWGKNNTKICSGSSDKMVYIFDVKSGKMEYKLPGHKGSVNKVDYHPKEDIVVSGSNDKTLYLGEL